MFMLDIWEVRSYTMISSIYLVSQTIYFYFLFT